MGGGSAGLPKHLSSRYSFGCGKLLRPGSGTLAGLIAAQTGLAEVAYRQANWDLAALRLDNILMSSPEHELAKYWRDILKLGNRTDCGTVGLWHQRLKGPGKETKVKKKKKKRNRKKKSEETH